MRAIATISVCALATSLARTGPITSESSFIISIARDDIVEHFDFCGRRVDFFDLILLARRGFEELMRRRREMQWAARINAALEEDRFELFRMPIQPLQSAETGSHYELLLRLKDEAGRIVAPNDFIAAAERYGITPAIDRWVIENAFRWLVSEADEREKLNLCSINLSGQSLGDAWVLAARNPVLAVPSVIVPVLSRNSTSTSPAASTERPLIARTFF